MDQQQKVIKESLNLNSSLMEFTGPKLTKLVLTRLDGKSTVEVISPFEDCNEFTKCGSFIMYPWVGRLTSTENLFKYMGKEVKEFPKMDISRGFPLHGFFLTADRKVVAKDNNTISFESIDTSYFDLFPKFTEKYILKDSTLEIETTFENTTDKTQYFAYGYHPYLGIDSTSINDLN